MENQAINQQLGLSGTTQNSKTGRLDHCQALELTVEELLPLAT